MTLSRVAAVTVAVMADALRRKTVYVVLFFAFVLSAMIPSLPTLGVGVVDAVFREIGLAVMFVATLVTVLALTATRVPSEVERRTVYAMLARDMSRWEYLVGTWAGIWLTIGWVVAAFLAITIGIGAFQYKDAMWVLWQGALAIWFEMGVVAALALLVSTRVGPAPVALAALTFLFIGHSRASVLTPDSGVLWTLYPSLDAFNTINAVAHGGGVGADYLGSMTLVFAAYVALLLVVAALLFRGRDL